MLALTTNEKSKDNSVLLPPAWNENTNTDHARMSQRDFIERFCNNEVEVDDFVEKTLFHPILAVSLLGDTDGYGMHGIAELVYVFMTVDNYKAFYGLKKFLPEKCLRLPRDIMLVFVDNAESIYAVVELDGKRRICTLLENVNVFLFVKVPYEKDNRTSTLAVHTEKLKQVFVTTNPPTSKLYLNTLSGEIKSRL